MLFVYLISFIQVLKILPYLRCPLVFVVFPEFLEPSKYDQQRIKPFSADFVICFIKNTGNKTIKKMETLG